MSVGRWQRIVMSGCSAYQSADGHWRVINPWTMDTAVRREWIVREREDVGSAVWATHDGGFATMREAKAYCEEQ